MPLELSELKELEGLDETLDSLGSSDAILLNLVLNSENLGLIFSSRDRTVLKYCQLQYSASPAAEFQSYGVGGNSLL